MSEYVFEDYSDKYKEELNTWSNDPEIKKFAFNGLFSDEWQYYLDSKDYKVNEDAFCKVIKLNNELIGAMIVLGINTIYPININPIIINPKLRGCGHGTKALNQFINNLDKIIPNNNQKIEVGFIKGNIGCQKMLEKCGFKYKSTHPDGDYLYYEKNLK